MDPMKQLQQMSTMLSRLDGWLAKAIENAAARSFDVDVLASARLAPDMFPLTRQVSSACDATKYSAAYLSGKTAPSIPDTETTIAQCRERIATARAYLETFTSSDFDGWTDRRVAPPWARGKAWTAANYFGGIGWPNFMFHVSMAYAILRHNGVPLGKQDFLPLPPFIEE